MKNDKTKNTAKEIPETLSVAPGVKPFTKYRVIELIVCAVAVVLGLLYLYTDIVVLELLLPLYAVFFCAIAVLRYLDTKELGMKGFVSMLPVGCWAFLAVAVIVATVTYFLQ